MTLPTPLYGPDFGSYAAEDVAWLLKDLSDIELEASIEDREEAIQSGGAHYAESLPVEYQPSEQYQELFKTSLSESGRKMADAVAIVTKLIIQQRGEGAVLVSLARAGTPIGVLIRLYAQEKLGLDLKHYAVSIVRGKGIDRKALEYLAEHHDPSKIVFVDGWTGKGAITKELQVALDLYATETGVRFPADIAVLADPAVSVKMYGTREDFLIPSACLNSTVSGLVSRTVLNDAFIDEDHDFHGAKFYHELAVNDYSNYFVDTIVAHFSEINDADVNPVYDTEEPTWDGWKAVERVSEAYGIHNVNLVKPGTGETTRVLLRRVPWRILVQKDAVSSLSHILLLAENRGVPVELVDELPYSCMGLIHPNYTKGATGFDGAGMTNESSEGTIS